VSSPAADVWPIFNVLLIPCFFCVCLPGDIIGGLPSLHIFHVIPLPATGHLLSVLQPFLTIIMPSDPLYQSQGRRIKCPRDKAIFRNKFGHFKAILPKWLSGSLRIIYLRYLHFVNVRRS
jgi:hypothetical protein